jgi:ElaB/YqjD/DUF883 family membrane-anchored ribosome-binding protein
VAEDPNAIRREIEDTREEMADTIDALEYKADVKSRTKEKVDEVRETVAERADTVLSSIKATAQRVTEGMSGDTDDTGSTMQRGGPEMTDRAREAMRRGKQLIEDNPLLLAIGATAAGFLLGMALPGRSTEGPESGRMSGRMASGATPLEHQTVGRTDDRVEGPLGRTIDQARYATEEMREGRWAGLPPRTGTTYGRP